MSLQISINPVFIHKSEGKLGMQVQFFSSLCVLLCPVSGASHSGFAYYHSGFPGTSRAEAMDLFPGCLPALLLLLPHCIQKTTKLLVLQSS